MMSEKKSKALMFLVITVMIIFILDAGAALFKYHVRPEESWYHCSNDKDCTDETVCYDLPINKKFQKQARLNQSLLPYKDIQCWDRKSQPKREVQCVKDICKVIIAREKFNEWRSCNKDDECVAVLGRDERYHPSNKKYKENAKEFWNRTFDSSDEGMFPDVYETKVLNVHAFCEKHQCEVKEQIKEVRRIFKEKLKSK